MGTMYQQKKIQVAPAALSSKTTHKNKINKNIEIDGCTFRRQNY